METITIITWEANYPYSQLRANCEGRGYNVFEKQAPIMTTNHSQRSKVFDFFKWSGKRKVSQT